MRSGDWRSRANETDKQNQENELRLKVEQKKRGRTESARGR